MNRALIIGSVNIDKTYELEKIVSPGETVKSLGLRSAWGGKGLNQAIALAKAGADVSLAACVAEETNAALKSFCAGFGLDASLVRSVSAPTGHAIIQVDSAGQNCIIVEPGANNAMDPDIINKALAGFGAGDILLLQNEINMMPEIIRAGHEKGMRVVLNPSPITEEILTWPLDMVDIFIANETEGALLSGKTHPLEILEVLAPAYPNASIVLTVGADGAFYKSPAEMFHVDALKVNAIDTTAAGDTFTGYFLSGILNGLDAAASMELATKASAVTVTRKGAADSIPVAAELL